MHINELNLDQVKQALAAAEAAWYAAPEGARRLALGEACVALHDRKRRLEATAKHIRRVDAAIKRNL